MRVINNLRLRSDVHIFCVNVLNKNNLLKSRLLMCNFGDVEILFGCEKNVIEKIVHSDMICEVVGKVFLIFHTDKT